MHKYLNCNKTLKMSMYFPYLLLYHKHKHKHNITKHNTPIFIWFTTKKAATSTGTLSIWYSIKGNYKVPLCTTCTLSLFLRAFAHQATRALSSFSLSKWSILLPIRYSRTKCLCKDMASCIDKRHLSLYHILFIYNVT